ncbi:hypothetical protein M885DRAFT_331004 [Pelagophyceae sp. CCMP2097]|nr:hypothetical protein M885DRAFT_331004 [Pelagophyceae sp. CCMP2097]
MAAILLPGLAPPRHFRGSSASLGSVSSQSSQSSSSTNRSRPPLPPFALPKVQSWRSSVEGFEPALATWTTERALRRRKKREAEMAKAGLAVAYRPPTERATVLVERVSEGYDVVRGQNRNMLSAFAGPPCAPALFRKQFAKAFGVVLPQAAVDELAQIFDTGEGLVDGVEFARFFQQVGTLARAKRLQGSTEYDAIRESAKSSALSQKSDAALPKMLAPSEEEILSYFEIFDKNGSGAVSAAELKAVEGVLRFPRPAGEDTVYDAALMLQSVSAVILEACSVRGFLSRDAGLDDFCGHFKGRLRLCDVFAALVKSLDVRLCAAQLAALAAALGGVDKANRVNGDALRWLLLRWLNEKSEVASRKRFGQRAVAQKMTGR